MGSSTDCFLPDRWIRKLNLAWYFKGI